MPESIDKLHEHSRKLKSTMHEHYFNGTEYNTWHPVDTVVYMDDGFHGTKNPHWRTQVARGQNASTAYSADRESVHVKPYAIGEGFGVSGSSNPLWKSHFYVDGNISIAVPATVTQEDPLVTKADNRAKSEFVRKIRAKQTSFEGGTFLGELGRTILMIRNPAMALRRQVARYQRAVKRRHSSVSRIPRRATRIKEANKIVADTWLEYQLGWMPLVNEIVNGTNAIADAHFGDKHYTDRVIAFGEAEDSEPAVLESTFTTPGFTYELLKSKKVLVKYYGGVGWGPSAVGYSVRKVGLDSSNLLPTVWELIPYSFVVDYFSNVGDIISAYSLASSSLRWSCKVIRTEHTHKVSNWKPVWRWPESWTYSGGTAWREEYYALPGDAFSRKTAAWRYSSAGSLVPDLEFSLPWSSTQWLNIAALAVASKEIRKLFRI